ncbi:MAG: hypothetical protein DI534_13330 [Leifsonia xyli]|nr:MAG: hypothetical protein DI534_13330 [Leifsonia xyli]
MTRRSAAAATIAALILPFTLSACTAEPPVDGVRAPAVVTFEVAETQSYSIRLDTQEQVDHVIDLMNGDETDRIPNGKINRDGDGGVNAPWSWHIDPATLEFVDVTTEVCDGLPEYVEDGTLTSDWFCPWIAVPTKLEPLSTSG